MKTGTVIDGKYEILKVIGKGGMSVVYLAADLRLNKRWAVKEILKGKGGKKEKTARNSLIAEANLMKHLDHPAIARIVDILEDVFAVYIVMDYIEGRSLDRVMKERGPLPEEEVIGIAGQLCDVFGYLHSLKRPVIYRDIKPGNIMLNPDGNIKIIDFGAACEYGEESCGGKTVLGTKGYAPPEQYQGRTDQRSDIYALGMTMHNLLTGVDPGSRQAYAPVRSYNPAVSEETELIIDKCTRADPEERYQDCQKLRRDLEHPRLITRGYRKKLKKRLFAFIAAEVLCAAFLAAGIICDASASAIKANRYEVLIERVNDTDSYIEAIELFPEDTRAYIKILETYENNGFFGPDESSQIQYLYNANREFFDLTDTGYAALNYKLGTMYFNCYVNDEEGNYSVLERIRRAGVFFKANYENEYLPEDFEEAALCGNYYRICVFYETYIFASSEVEEASKEDYDDLLETLGAALDELADQGEYDRLVFYNMAFKLVHDQRSRMAAVSVDEESVLGLFDEIYEETFALSVSRDQSAALRDEILENYEQYRKDIEISCENAARQSEEE